MKILSPPGTIRLCDVPPSEARETIRRGSRLLSRKVGIVRWFSHSMRRAQDPWFYSFGARTADLSRWPGVPAGFQGGGSSERFEGALAAAIGEAVERYCMLFYDHDSMVLARYREVAGLAVHPDEIRLHSREQTGSNGTARHLDYFDEDTLIRWVWGHHLASGTPVLVPASLVFVGYRGRAGEAWVGDNASTGLASAATFEEAVLGGIYECVERDAFTLSWLRRRLRQRISVDDPALQAFLAKSFHAGYPGVDYRLYEATLDLRIPTLVAVLRRPAEFGPVLCIGAAARLDPRAAAWKATLEAGQEFSYLRSLHLQEPDWQPAVDYSNVDTFEKHVLLYLRRPELATPALAFCDEAGESPLSSLPGHSTGGVLGDLEACLAALSEVGSEAIAVDVTTPDIRSLGLVAVRVLTTRLMPLHYDHRRPYLGVQRLREAAGGNGPRGQAAAELNPYPHPFP